MCFFILMKIKIKNVLFHFNENKNQKNSEWAQNATPTIYLLVTILNYIFYFTSSA